MRIFCLINFICNFISLGALEEFKLDKEQFELNFEKISRIYENKVMVPFEENKDNFIKVAFDVYSPKNDPSDNLWIVQKADDGSDYLVRTDWDHDYTIEKKSKGDGWDVAMDKEGNTATLYFKDVPLVSLSAKDYGFDSNSGRFINCLLRFMNNKKNVATLLESLPESKLAAFRKIAKESNYDYEDN